MKIHILDVAGKFCNAALHLFKLLGGCRQLPLAAHFILLDKQLHEPGFMLLCVSGHFPYVIGLQTLREVGVFFLGHAGFDYPAAVWRVVLFHRWLTSFLCVVSSH